MFVDYKDKNGYQIRDHGNRIFIVKNFDKQHWERARKDLQLYHYVDWDLIYEDIDLFGRSGDTCNVKLMSNFFYDWWNVKTLKCHGWKAKDDKLRDSWASWKVVDAKSSIFFFFFCIWLFC
jgi:hypothetical protein